MFYTFRNKINNVASGNPDDGMELEIIMQRKIMNELLTTYLPTIFILCIVYATNFFKPFFFEAVVTVNLTSQLVLTTLFISVSNSLPPTAYVKMIDVWLIFSQLIPFVSVLLHTFMDNMRTEGDREINHHGEVRKIKTNVINVRELDGSRPNSAPKYVDMTQRNEKDLVEARKAFYENADVKVHLLEYGEIAGWELNKSIVRNNLISSQERNTVRCGHLLCSLLVVRLVPLLLFLLKSHK